MTNDFSFVKRLREILSSRYGCTLSIRTLQLASDLLPSEEPQIVNKKFIIPILSEDKVLLGTAVISNIETLSQDHLEGITVLVRMVLEPALKNKDL